MFIITIDGPASSGKGTIANIIANKLGFNYLESGAIYRVIGLLALEHGYENITEVPQLLELLNQVKLVFKDSQVLLDGRNVTQLIRQEKVGMLASRFAAVPEVRASVLKFQRDFATEPGLITDGRDMGSAVFPDAHLKVFLTASSEVRANRRYTQLINNNVAADYQAILNDIVTRDKQDSERSVAPMTYDDTFIIIDNSLMTIDETVNKIVSLYHGMCH